MQIGLHADAAEQPEARADDCLPARIAIGKDLPERPDIDVRWPDKWLHFIIPTRKINFEACRFLIGSREVLDLLNAGAGPGGIEERLREPVQKFAERRRPFLLY